MPAASALLHWRSRLLWYLPYQHAMPDRFSVFSSVSSPRSHSLSLLSMPPISDHVPRLIEKPGQQRHQGHADQDRIIQPLGLDPEIFRTFFRSHLSYLGSVRLPALRYLSQNGCTPAGYISWTS